MRLLVHGTTLLMLRPAQKWIQQPKGGFSSQKVDSAAKSWIQQPCGCGNQRVVSAAKKWTQHFLVLGSTPMLASHVRHYLSISLLYTRATNKSLVKAQNSRNYSMEGGDRKHAAIVLSYSSLKMGRKIRIQIEL